MTNPNQPRSPSRVGNQDLTQLLIRAVDKLRTIPAEIKVGNGSVENELQNIVTSIDLNTAAIDANTVAVTDCLSQIMQTYTAEGGAGLVTTSDNTGVNITVDNTWLTLDQWDDKQLPEVDASGDPNTGLITINATGIWALSFTMTMNVTDSAANETRYLELALYNTIDLTPWVFGTVAIPRYGDKATLYGTLRFEVDADNLSEPLGVAIRTPAGYSDVVVEDILAAGQLSVGRELTKL